MIRKLKPDVVTLDIRMPEMNGIKVLEAIKQEKLSVTPIMLSGVGEDQYRDKCLSLGAEHFFDKATEFELLLQVLSQKVAELEGNQG
jgi:two-component system response regulator YesN